MLTFCLIQKNVETAESLKRYIKFVVGRKSIVAQSLNDAYSQKEVFEKAQKSDFLVVDGVTNEKPMGFQFAKAMEKRVLLLFYPGELEIEEEGPFWLVLPQGLDRLGDKIKELMEKPAPEAEDYEKLEERFPELRERKGHHK